MSTKKLQILGGLPQSDWSQNDENSFDYIRNKPENLITSEEVQLKFDEAKAYTDSLIPTSDDALALSYEMGLVEPAVNNGYVLVDANGVIYTI